jgi:hypothetical protein
VLTRYEGPFTVCLESFFALDFFCMRYYGFTPEGLGDLNCCY